MADVSLDCRDAAVEFTDDATVCNICEEMPSPSLRIPYTQQFTPESTPLRKLLPILRQHHGKSAELTEAIASAFFGKTKSPSDMAANTIISLKFHGIIDDKCEPTQLGTDLLNARRRQSGRDSIKKSLD